MNRKTHPYFVPDSESGAKETAILLLAAARDAGLDVRSVRSTRGGFRITEALADVVYPPSEGGVEEPGNDSTEDGTGSLSDAPDPAGENAGSGEGAGSDEGLFDPAEHTVAQVKEFVAENPEMASALLEAEQGGKNRQSLVDWLADNTSGDPAVKDQTTSEKENQHG